MILSNVEIQAAIDDGRLIIDPEPLPREPTVGHSDCPYDAHSVDLRLGSELSIPERGAFAYDHMQPGLTELISKHTEKRNLYKDQPFRLDPQRFVLGMTLERVGLPINPKRKKCLAARIEGKSSRARCGLLIHFTAPTVHPGWNGPLVLEMINLGPSAILLTPEMYIAQLIVEEVRGIPSPTKPSEFHGQQHPDGTP
jgi:dCTP deaminase